MIPEDLARPTAQLCPRCKVLTTRVDTSRLEAVLHQLDEGPASDGDPDDIQWCASTLREYLRELQER